MVGLPNQKQDVPIPGMWLGIAAVELHWNCISQNSLPWFHGSHAHWHGPRETSGCNLESGSEIATIHSVWQCRHVTAHAHAALICCLFLVVGQPLGSLPLQHPAPLPTPQSLFQLLTSGPCAHSLGSSMEDSGFPIGHPLS